MADTVTTGGGQSQAQEKVQDAAGQAREKAQEGAQRAREGLRGQVDQRSTQAGQQVRQQSDDIRSVAQQLREQGKDGPAKLADQAADSAQSGRQLPRGLRRRPDPRRRRGLRAPQAVGRGRWAVSRWASPPRACCRASSTDRYQSGATGPGAPDTRASCPSAGTAPYGAARRIPSRRWPRRRRSAARWGLRGSDGHARGIRMTCASSPSATCSSSCRRRPRRWCGRRSSWRAPR